jgi:hypothetical protein
MKSIFVITYEQDDACSNTPDIFIIGVFENFEIARNRLLNFINTNSHCQKLLRKQSIKFDVCEDYYRITFCGDKEDLNLYIKSYKLNELDLSIIGG